MDFEPYINYNPFNLPLTMSYTSIIPSIPSIKEKASRLLHNRFALINPENQQVYIASYNNNWQEDDLLALKYIKPNAFQGQEKTITQKLHPDRAKSLGLLYADEYQPENFIPYMTDENYNPIYELTH